MSTPLVSIIIPAYNAAAFIRRAVKSALAQTWQPVEVIVVNDGSTDDTAAVVQSLCAQHPQLRLISTENGGVSRARNTGMDASRGEYLTFLDADDVLLPDAVELLLTHLLACRADLCSGLCRDHPTDPPDSGLCRVYKGADALMLSLRDQRECYTVNAKLYRREIALKARFPEGAVAHEDSFFVFLCLMQDITFAALERYVYRHYTVAGSASLSGFNEKKLCILDLAERKQALVQQQWPALAPYAVNVRLKACMVVLLLLLQEPSHRFRAAEKTCLRYFYAHKDAYLPAGDAPEAWYCLLRRHGYYPRKLAVRLSRTARRLLRR